MNATEALIEMLKGFPVRELNTPQFFYKMHGNILCFCTTENIQRYMLSYPNIEEFLGSDLKFEVYKPE